MSSDKCPFGHELQRYWDRLSPAERQMELDEEALYSLTPQEVALEIARQTPGHRVLDAFCGAGGLAIALARQGKQVTAVDIDGRRLAMAARNAALFGVDHAIDFQQGDCLTLLPSISVDTVVLDPPWGGPGYQAGGPFLLSHFSPDGELLLRAAMAAAANVVLRLPKNFRFDELERFDSPCRIEENFLDKQLLHYCAYFSRDAAPPH